jgi:pimeloyl-ACP methyl ester carboxylesterase
MRGPSKERVIVFVHGLRGDADSTWTSSNGAYWPQLLLQDSTFDDFDIYVVNYPAHLGGSSTIEDIVSNLYSQLKVDNVTQHQDITFVCHSLGGIVTEHLLLDHPEVVARVSFVYLLGTPLTGSAVANYVSVFGSNPVTHALNNGQDNDSLQLLENHWKTYASKIVRYCGYEEKPWAGLGFIVDRQSATRDCDHEVAIDGDHQGIAKPSGRRELSYIGLVNAVRDHPAASSSVKNNPPAQHPPLPGPPPSTKLYNVDSLSTLFLPGVLWGVYKTGRGDTVTPIDVLAELLLVNVQKIPASLSSFSVELNTPQGWMPLKRIPSEDVALYWGSLTQAKLIKLEPGDIYSELENAEITAGRTIRGTALFEFSNSNYIAQPREHVSDFRFTVKDTAGHTAVLESTPKSQSTDPRSNLGKLGLVWGADVVDLSHLPMKRINASPDAKAELAGNGLPTMTQQPQPTYSVTNPSGSIINQGSKVDAPQTINNYAPPRRVISPTENEEARKVLLASPEKHKPLLLINGGDETQAFALQLASIFESSNWPLFGGGAARSDSFAPIGYEVELCVYPGNISAMDDAKVIQEAFSKAGIKAPIIEDERMNAEPDKVHILVFPIQDGISQQPPS